MLGISVWKFLSLYEAVTWDSFLRLFTIFTWISWDFFSFVIYKCSNRCYCWCICCRSFCSVHIFTNNCNRWSYSCKFRFWFEGYCSVWCYSICTNTWNSFSCWTIVKGCWNIIIHWNTTVAFFECWFARLFLTFWSNSCSWFTCWCYWGHSWCVLSCDWGTVLVYTFYSHACSCASEWFFWDESYCSIGCYCVCSFAWNCLRSWTIVKGCRRIIIHWYIWITCCKCRFACLGLTLFIRWSCRFSSRSYWSNLRCVSCFHSCSVNIFRLNLNWNHITWVWFISWCEGYNTCFLVNCETTDNLAFWWFSIYWSSWLTIFVKKSNSLLVDRDNWISCCEGHCSSLNQALRCFWFCWCCCWSYWCNSWSILSCRWGTILIYTFNSYACSCSCEWFFWYECNRSVWCNCVCSFSWDYLSCWTIVKGCRDSIIHWYTAIAFCEGWGACLCLTLDICRCNIFSSRSYWSNLRCVSCLSDSSVCIFTLNLNWKHITWVWFIRWREGHNTCVFINGEGTNNLAFWWLSIYRYSCLTIFVKKSNSLLVDWYNWITFCESNCSSLNHTLRSSWFGRNCCWCYWCNSWSILSCRWGTILIYTFNSYACSCSCEWFFWYECNRSVWCNCVCSFSWDYLSCWTIVKCCWNIFIDVYCFLNTINCHCSTLEFRFTYLSSTLNIRCFSWCSCWGYWNNFRCVCCIHLDAIWTFSLNLNRRYLTCIRFVSWGEGYLTSCWINCEGTDFSCTVSRISWCSWNFVTIFV